MAGHGQDGATADDMAREPRLEADARDRKGQREPRAVEVMTTGDLGAM